MTVLASPNSNSLRGKEKDVYLRNLTVLDSSNGYDRIPQTEKLKQQTFIYHRSEEWEGDGPG